jgi:hypothetical protein
MHLYDRSHDLEILAARGRASTWMERSVLPNEFTSKTSQYCTAKP